MKKTELINSFSGYYYKLCFQAKKYSPEIFLVAGIAGGIASTILACKATTKVSTILEKTEDDIESVHKVINTNNPDYSKQDEKKDLVIIYVQTGVKLVKLYSPAVVLGALSIGSILASNNILRNRNLALAAAYATVDKGFKEYRARVIERFGKDVDHELKYNIKAKKIEELEADENGIERKVKKTVNVIEGYSEYAKFFDAGCNGWEKDSEQNLIFLRAQQNIACDRLRARRYLFLNEVYQMLGIPRTRAGQSVGWIYDPKDPRCDNYVDFGIYDLYKQNQDFVNGYEQVILLDFNVDGPILDRAPIGDI